MDIIKIFSEAFVGSISSVYSIALIVFPLLVALEVAKDLEVLNWLSRIFRPVSRLFKISDEAALPLMAGLIFGISYGAGAIIQSAKEGKMTRRDMMAVNMFLVICHSIFEDTLLFVAIGANGWMILLFRLLAAVLITMVFGWYTYNKGQTELLIKDESF